MKLILTLTAALIGGIALPGLLMAGPTENITGCATVADPATNFTTFADPTCYAAPEGGSGVDGLFLVVISKLLEDQEAE